MAFLNSEECRAYYRSLRNLSRYYENPEFQWKFKLKPGKCVDEDKCTIYGTGILYVYV